MSIIIKELFKSDLDQYTSNWWSSKKIEKLNFNFDQIALSGGGPAGPSGFPGDQGPDGNKDPNISSTSSVVSLPPKYLDASLYADSSLFVMI